MNGALLRDAQARWRLKRPAPAVWAKQAWFAPPPQGACLRFAQTALRRPVLRGGVNAAGRLARLDWILTSPESLHGRFTGGLTVGVVPMHIAMRGRFEGWGEPVVRHSSIDKCG